MDSWHLLLDILILLGGALVLGVVCERLRQSPILGYLAAGTLLGPNALQIVSTADEVTVLAELGVALLLFTIGLEFSWPRLKKLGSAAFGGGTGQVLVTLGLAAGCAMILGLNFRSSLAIGAIVALSSTAVVLRLLISRAEIESAHGRFALGILLMQDVAVVPLVLLVTVIGEGGSLQEMSKDISLAIVGALGLVAVLYVLLNKVAPKVMGLGEMQRNRDLPILLAIVIGLGSTWGSHKLGLSPALGAFVAGMILAESPFATQMRADIGSIRTLLVTLFFSSIGMLGDPAWFLSHLPQVLGFVAAIVIGKSVVIWAVLKSFGLTHRHALAAGICLGQVGEFSFVLAAVARGTVISEEMFTLIISSTIVTLFLTPYLVAFAPRVSGAVVGVLERAGVVKAGALETVGEQSAASDRLVVIGFGPAGEAVAHALDGHEDRVTVLDLNPSSIRRANQLGYSAHIGNAAQAEVLEHAGVENASAVVVTVPDPGAAREIVELVRTLAPGVHIIARARYHRFFEDIQRGGADDVVNEEWIVGAILASRVRARLRKSEQVDEAVLEQEDDRSSDQPLDDQD
ncbi:MAG: cation:proton antiporter [Phycisphaerales bacterium]|nr:cation:proton antiporter [Phycisphaerales bacterium]